MVGGSKARFQLDCAPFAGRCMGGQHNLQNVERMLGCENWRRLVQQTIDKMACASSKDALEGAADRRLGLHPSLQAVDAWVRQVDIDGGVGVVPGLQIDADAPLRTVNLHCWRLAARHGKGR